MPVLADIERLDVDGLADVLRGCDAVVWSAGAGGGDPARTTAVDRDAAIRSMEAAGRAGVRRYVMVSYFGSPDRSVPESNPFRHYARAKADADEQLAATDLEWTILGPSRLTDDPGDGRIEVDPLGAVPCPATTWLRWWPTPSPTRRPSDGPSGSIAAARRSPTRSPPEPDRGRSDLARPDATNGHAGQRACRESRTGGPWKHPNTGGTMSDPLNPFEKEDRLPSAGDLSETQTWRSTSCPSTPRPSPSPAEVRPRDRHRRERPRCRQRRRAGHDRDRRPRERARLARGADPPRPGRARVSVRAASTRAGARAATS